MTVVGFFHNIHSLLSLTFQSHLLYWKTNKRQTLHFFSPFCVTAVLKVKSCVLCFHCWAEFLCCVYSKVMYLISLLLQLKIHMRSPLKKGMKLQMHGI